ncbi:hypothetical protein RM533_11505 [Croceicoccus sp. F390]|uniref:Uncharacterized protein n=1 Tax=Croceicoccus esteveae TaxID=3075597 RepID=A0ABU2ZKG2_9SPHN|nr:hypothetical protein [Croceicoccus sp. F390]MDT0576799.1 hypothetical protein [Croceicoccus sp. F390]
MADPTNDNAFENVNTEQRDKDAQAQTVAQQAKGRSASSYVLDENSTKPAPGITDDENSTPDLVDKIKQMDTGGIDMSAYRGEPNHDDNEKKYGKSNIMKDEPGNSDS